ncbi:hypothetical protein HMPREF1581_01390 [Gardnerella vaginalis JCP8108]|uniref:Uncharacterized protein n=1 Tax=Gardnerella vaginalis JCP8108 TaxID=1261066 RepID=S4GN23_GARVA|nr:hypothetical protein HMPREF1581_01390 [Gardnerella vaginalis JCP8108]
MPLLRCLRRNKWCDVTDADYVSIARFPQNVGIDEYFLHAMPSFFQNVGIEHGFL